MTDAALHVIVGPNGAGKSTFFEVKLQPTTGLPLVNADLIARQRWPEDAAARSYEAAKIAEQVRDALIDQNPSCVAETVFSHPDEVHLLRRARAAGYRVTLHVVMVPQDGAVAHVVYVYDNTSSSRAFRRVATFLDGELVGTPDWPDWTPEPLRSAGRG